MSLIVSLAVAQLEAYNASDLDAFCACYHDDVVILEGSAEVCRGKDAFRARYTSLFENWTFGGVVPSRLEIPGHCVEHERWWRIDPTTGQRSEGEVLVSYSERDGKIGVVQFLKPA